MRARRPGRSPVAYTALVRRRTAQSLMRQSSGNGAAAPKTLHRLAVARAERLDWTGTTRRAASCRVTVTARRSRRRRRRCMRRRSGCRSDLAAVGRERAAVGRVEDAVAVGVHGRTIERPRPRAAAVAVQVVAAGRADVERGVHQCGADLIRSQVRRLLKQQRRRARDDRRRERGARDCAPEREGRRAIGRDQLRLVAAVVRGAEAREALEQRRGQIAPVVTEGSRRPRRRRGRRRGRPCSRRAPAWRLRPRLSALVIVRSRPAVDPLKR